jgi:hypothetical protein
MRRTDCRWCRTRTGANRPGAASDSRAQRPAGQPTKAFALEAGEDFTSDCHCSRCRPTKPNAEKAGSAVRLAWTHSRRTPFARATSKMRLNNSRPKGGEFATSRPRRRTRGWSASIRDTAAVFLIHQACHRGTERDPAESPEPTPQAHKRSEMLLRGLWCNQPPAMLLRIEHLEQAANLRSSASR